MHIDEDVHEPDLPRTDLNQGVLADRKCGELDPWVDWWDKDFKDFGPMSAGANAGLVAFRWTGREGSPGAEPLRLGARRAEPAPRPWSTAARQGGRVAIGRETAFPAPVVRIPADVNSVPINREQSERSDSSAFGMPATRNQSVTSGAGSSRFATTFWYVG